MHILELQRDNMLTALGSDPADEYLAMPDLMMKYLASLGYTQPTLPERLALWAAANGYASTQALTEIAT